MNGKQYGTLIYRNNYRDTAKLWENDGHSFNSTMKKSSVAEPKLFVSAPAPVFITFRIRIQLREPAAVPTKAVKKL
jgi:hypothetical protein